MNEEAITNQEPPGKMSSLSLSVFTVAGFAFAYFIAHQIAFFFPDTEKVIASVWPAGGIGLAAFLLSPYRLWPWLFLSFFIGGIGADVLLNNRSFFAGVGYMTGNMVESLGSAWLIIKWCGRDIRFTRVNEVLALLTGTIFVNALSTSIGAGTARLSRDASFRDIWIGWYIADGLGILLVTPLIVTWAKLKDLILRLRQEWAVEVVIFTVLWVTAAWFSFQPGYFSRPLAPHYYMLVAILAWPALRLGQQTLSLSLVLLAIIAITSKAVSEGPSPCGGDNLTDRLLLVQMYLGITAFTGFLLSAIYTEFQSAEKSLQVSEVRYRTLVEETDCLITNVDKNGCFTYVNDIGEKVYGKDKDALVGLPAFQFILPDDRSKTEEWFNECINNNLAQSSIENRQLNSSTGEITHFLWTSSFIYDDKGQIKSVGSIAHNITERKRAENELRESEERYRELTNFLPVSIFEIDAAGSIISFNRTALEVFRYNKEDYKEGMNAHRFFAPEEWKRVEENMGKVIQGTSTPGQEYTFLRKDGSKFIGLIYSSRIIQQNKPVGIRGTIIDITERKQAEESLRKSQEKFAKAFQASPVMVNITSISNGQFIEVNETFEKVMGYTREEALASTTIDLDLWVNPAERERLLQILLANGRLRNEEIQFCTKSGEVITCLLSAELIELGGEAFTLSVTENITDRKDMVKRLQRTMESLRKAANTTIQVIASTVEARDPYTAGHQIRTADLAHAIATEMGLSQEKIEGVQMAGSIHDLGKISIPSEILSKPAKLDEIEFSMIKTHSQRGYRILKGVESSWPLAEIIYQHHERMDGSGYPRNLKGDDILIEARILTVADVVEAMASHRPYRAALGIEAALNEIEKNKGVFYDKAVTDACLRLFREKGFQLAVA